MTVVRFAGRVLALLVLAVVLVVLLLVALIEAFTGLDMTRRGRR